ncbi:hypothetical protein [Neosynechococcus sphagnicola]|nr:hypothetical protein [Neosynechococcus sphagnicola]
MASLSTNIEQLTRESGELTVRKGAMALGVAVPLVLEDSPSIARVSHLT